MAHATTSFLWRSTDGQEDINQLGQRASAEGVNDSISFTPTNLTDGKHLVQNEISLAIGLGDNENPLDLNELQDTAIDNITITLTGTVENKKTNDVIQLTKEWLLEDKTDLEFTKGRFGLELTSFSDGITLPNFNVIPMGTGGTIEQPRGYILTDWRWILDGEVFNKAAFIATLRFNGDIGDDSTTPTFDWTVRRI